MKKWNNPEIVALDLSSTEHQWKFKWELDAGYIGDGKITGWFGTDPKPANSTPSTPASVTPETIVTDLNS